jgi:D-glycero-D-manno-heptose 1,7-bisphosphate phosphatase
VARRRVSPEVLDSIHRYLLDVFFDALAPITKIYVCPHEGGCECRKPAPGMLLRAAEEHAIDLHASWVVGDSATDIEAGKRAGCRTTWIRDGMAQKISGVRPDLQAKDLRHAVKLILEVTERSARGQGRSHRRDLSKR